MYIPAHFSESDTEKMYQFIQRRSFGTLVVLTSQGLEANSIPFVLHNGHSEHGILQGHIARANAVWQRFSSDVNALVIFQGHDAYISPSWYPTKQEHGKVVPTWNYVAVHVSGKLKVIEDSVWLYRHLNELTEQHESSFSHPWRVDDAPKEFTDRLVNGIIGLEMTITDIVGKWKVSQNQPQQNRLAVARMLQEQGNDLANEIPVH
ncbi:MAG: FMN-binding negative transcriptional regulator [Proteobacteria bacterium]|nr:FMN-binding negative transcriptional regulator [Pseudomonadota bacterium]